MSELLGSGALGLDDEVAFEESLLVDVDGSTVELEPDRLAGPLPPRPLGHSAHQPSWVGKVLGHFRLLRLLGDGSMGRVIQAQDIHLGRVVALKVLRKRLSGIGEDAKVEQFLREARAAARIDHPNVIRVYEINQHEGWWYIAMELLEGDTLKDMINAVGPLPPGQACPLVADAAIALEVAHELGVIHRDVKPSNLMTARDGRCKLTDFGLVRVSDPEDPFRFTDKSVGTLLFMAPEMIRRDRQTPAIDVYSLGATLYYALAGRPPYTGKTGRDLVQKHLNSPSPDLRKQWPTCPVSLATLVRSMMAKEPRDRPCPAAIAAALHAETIAWRVDESAVAIPTGGGSGIGSWTPAPSSGSTVLQTPLATAAAPAAAPEAGPEAMPQTRPTPSDDQRAAEGEGVAAAIKRHPWAAAAAAAVVVLVATVLTVDWPSRPPVPAKSGLVERFPDAPESYGLRRAGEPLPAKPVSEAPPFSWKGGVDTAAFLFVASKRGCTYYGIDEPDALLIHAEDFIGYATVEAAEADGKTATP